MEVCRETGSSQETCIEIGKGKSNHLDQIEEGDEKSSIQPKGWSSRGVDWLW